ncbi:2-hydroxyacyl-CoA dehydratase family protein [Mariluticola halotolerans]|uniref:2-hydroxyacyl-CoA dehydratase family protein n=1 Tax=Mariluticola halotolerans TaxID=2909283 RepID=UPI0026E302C1|nr:2-hydroxyacyl-CoA dehydratase family protein [Mariluticola halotolerans]UJQ93360.1 2-hydroxyacyl-CoA dehydratase family protein [Mariluticola halotolerans]
MTQPAYEPLAATALAKERQKQWFTDFRDRAINEGEPYVIAAAVSPHEIFHTMGVPLVTNTWYSSIISAKRLSPYYFDLMEKLGYHADLPRYLSLPMMTTLDGDAERAPYGGLPKPAMIVDRLRGDYAQRISRQWAAAFGSPHYFLDVPAQTRLAPDWWNRAQHAWENLYEPHRLDFYVNQIKGLIAFAQEETGRRFDLDAFGDQMHKINAAGENVSRARDLIASADKLPVAMPDQLTNVMAATWNRGSQWSVDHTARYADEIAGRVENGTSVAPNEKKRLLWLNTGLWFNTAFYRAFEESHGAVFVWSMYSNYLSDGYRKYSSSDPLRALAARSISMNEQLHLPPWMSGWILKQAEDFRADGAVMLTPIGDRLSAFGTRACIDMLERNGLPVLELSASMVDARMWDNDEMIAKVGNFIETRL